MKPLLLLLALAGVARAQGLDVAADGVEVSALAGLVERYAGVRVEVDGDVARRKVTLRLEKARPETALRCVAFAAGAVARRRPDGGWRVEDAPKGEWTRDALAALRERRFDTAEAKETPLPELLARLRDATGLNVVLDPGAGLDEVVHLPPAGERSAFEHLVALASNEGPAFDVRWETVFVTTEARLAELRDAAEATADGEAGAKEKETARRLAERRLDLPDEESAVSALLERIAKATEREIAFDPRAMAVVGRLKLRTPARAIAARSALDLLGAVTGFAYELRGDGVVIRMP